LDRLLERANPKERANVFADLGVTLTYQPDRDLVEVQAVPALDRACAKDGVGGGITPGCTPAVLRGSIDLNAV